MIQISIISIKSWIFAAISFCIIDLAANYSFKGQASMEPIWFCIWSSIVLLAFHSVLMSIFYIPICHLWFVTFKRPSSPLFPAIFSVISVPLLCAVSQILPLSLIFSVLSVLVISPVSQMSSPSLFSPDVFIFIASLGIGGFIAMRNLQLRMIEAPNNPLHVIARSGTASNT
jgi:hypothetical protein